MDDVSIKVDVFDALVVDELDLALLVEVDTFVGDNTFAELDALLPGPVIESKNVGEKWLKLLIDR